MKAKHGTAEGYLARLRDEHATISRQVVESESTRDQTKAKLERLDAELEAAEQASNAQTQTLAGELATGEAPGILGRLRKKLRSAKLMGIGERELAAAGQALMRSTISDTEHQIRELAERLRWIEQAIAVVEYADLSYRVTVQVSKLQHDVTGLAKLKTQIGNGPHLPIARCEKIDAWRRLADDFSFQDRYNRGTSNPATSCAWWAAMGHDVSDLEQRLDPGKHDIPKARAAVDRWLADAIEPAQPAPREEVKTA